MVRWKLRGTEGLPPWPPVWIPSSSKGKLWSSCLQEAFSGCANSKGLCSPSACRAFSLRACLSSGSWGDPQTGWEQAGSGAKPCPHGLLCSRVAVQQTCVHGWVVVWASYICSLPPKKGSQNHRARRRPFLLHVSDFLCSYIHSPGLFLTRTELLSPISSTRLLYEIWLLSHTCAWPPPCLCSHDPSFSTHGTSLTSMY